MCIHNYYQGTVLLSAVLYIVMGVPLYLCWISVFIVILAVSVLVVSGEIFLEF